MISHERLDRLVGQILPRRMARVGRRRRQPADRRQLRRRGVHDGVRPRGVRPDPRAERVDRATGCGPRPVPPASALGDDAAALGPPRADPSGALRAPLGGEARASQHRYHCRAAQFGSRRPAGGGRGGPDARATGAPGSPAARRLHRLHRLPRHRRDHPGDRRRRARARAARDVRAGGAGGAGVRNARGGVPDVGARRDPDHRKRRDRGQRSGCHRACGDVDHQPAGSAAPQQRAHGVPSSSPGRGRPRACSARWAQARRTRGEALRCPGGGPDTGPKDTERARSCGSRCC